MYCECVHLCGVDGRVEGLSGQVGRLAGEHVSGPTEGLDSTKSWPFKERDRRVYGGLGIQ